MFNSGANENQIQMIDQIPKTSSEQTYYNPNDFFQLPDNYYNNNGEITNYHSNSAARTSCDSYYNNNFQSYNYNNYLNYNTIQGYTDYFQSENNFQLSQSETIPIEYMPIKTNTQTLSPILCQTSYLHFDSANIVDNSVNNITTTNSFPSSFPSDTTASISAFASNVDSIETPADTTNKSGFNDDNLSTIAGSSDSSSETMQSQDNYQKKAYKLSNRSRVRNKTVSHHGLPDKALQILNNWFDIHIEHPYPTLDQKEKLAYEAGITIKQVNSWFCNKRNRSQNTKPKRFKRNLEQQLSNCFSEFKNSSNKVVFIEKLRNTLLNNDLNIRKYN